jgi:1-acyl-sn-glycerol-3-phosphate acyltransferase
MANDEGDAPPAGADGAVDHHGDTLPELSSSAAVARMEKLEAVRRRPKNPGDHPGSPLMWGILPILFRNAMKMQFGTVEVTGTEHIDNDAGMMTCGWHTNGLCDPLCVVATQSKGLVFGGRHDMLTRPVIGWFSSRLGAQPVIRQAEVKRGVASQEEATRINSETMLTIAECIAHGCSTALFPEGTSHVDSRMKRLRTGPMRTVIAAHSLSHEKGFSPARLLPVGLHYRTCWKFRTDLYVEYGPPIPKQDLLHSPEDRQRLLAGEWVEAPADSVHTLRDRVRDALAPMTPDADSWEQYASWEVLAHLRTQANGGILGTWREEVHAARDIRDGIRTGAADAPTSEEQEAAIRIGTTLLEADLDARVLDTNSNTGLRSPEAKENLAWLPGALLMLAALPLSLISTAPQAALAKYLGDSTDEGLDARCSYHAIAIILGPVLVWPIPAITLSVLAWCCADASGYGALEASLVAMFVFPLSFIVFNISNRVFLCGYDMFQISKRGRRLKRFSFSTEAAEVGKDVHSILGVLK